VVDDPAPGSALDVVPGEGAALQHLVQAGLLLGLAVVGILPVAGVVVRPQVGRSFTAIQDALHLVGVLEDADGQTTAVETGLELVVGLRSRIRPGRLDEARSQLRTAVAVTGALTTAIAVINI